MKEAWWRKIGNQTGRARARAMRLPAYAYYFMPNKNYRTVRYVRKAVHRFCNNAEEVMYHDLEVPNQPKWQVEGRQMEWTQIFYGAVGLRGGKHDPQDRPPKTRPRGVEATRDQWQALVDDAAAMNGELARLLMMVAQFAPQPGPEYWQKAISKFDGACERAIGFADTLKSMVEERGGAKVVVEIGYGDYDRSVELLRIAAKSAVDADVTVSDNEFETVPSAVVADRIDELLLRLEEYNGRFGVCTQDWWGP